MSSQQNDTTPLDTTDQITSNSDLDKFFATILLFCLVFGVPSNIFSLRYFLGTKRKKCISTSLYIAITITDTCSCFCHLPAMVSLYADRSPVMFESDAVCALWEIIFSFCQRYAMFLVMVLSLTRTIAITVPFYKMRRKSVVAAVIAYAVFLALHFALSAVVNIGFVYRAKGGYCFRNIDEQTIYTVSHMVILNLEIGLPPVITFFSFVICVVQLKRTTVKATRETNVQAAITVTIFTAVFLTCNVPYFVNMILALLSIFSKHIKTILGGSKFMFYFWTVSKIHFTVLNASLNPIVYYFRIYQFRRSVQRFLNKNAVSDWSQPSEFEMQSM